MARVLVLAGVLLTCAVVSAQSGGPIEQTGTSPRIEAVKRDSSLGTPGVAERFWAALARDHAPIVEPVQGDPTRLMVTFVWRGGPDTKSVQVFGMDMIPIAKTDIWYATITTARDHRIWYAFKPVTFSEPNPTPIAQPDPLNPHRFIPPVPQERPASAADHQLQPPFMSSSILVLPGMPTSPWVDPRAGVLKGRVDERRYESRIYGAPRRIWVYTPPGAGTPSGLLICFWGTDYLNEIPVPTILDNLLSEGRIPPLAAIFVDNGDDRFQDFQSTQKLTASLSGELMPWVRANTHVPADPHRTIVTGYSAAGLEAAYVAYAHPELFGNVLSQSGAFWRGFEGQGAPESEWLSHRYEAIPTRDTRFYLDVGGNENQTPTGPGLTFKDANRHLRDVLTRKGYAIKYNEEPGAEHDFMSWRTTIADGLLYLTSGWAAAR
jgi:enterochelin esterase family protein